MYDNYHYPPGADTPDAPWNQVDNSEEEFEITVSQSLSKTVTVFTSNYDLEIDYDDGDCYRNCDTSDTPWEDVYAEDHYTPLQLIGFLKRLLEGNEPISDNLKKHIIEECDNWCEDELEFVKE